MTPLKGYLILLEGFLSLKSDLQKNTFLNLPEDSTQKRKSRFSRKELKAKRTFDITV